MEALDIYHSVPGYQRVLEKLRKNPSLPKKNRELAVKWIRNKEHELKSRYSDLKSAEKDMIRMSKTLKKYVTMLTNICFWFPDLEKITKEELQAFKEKFYNDDIKSVHGKVLREKGDYVSKVIRSDFFKNYLNHKGIVEEVFNGKLVKNLQSVEFITLDDLKVILDYVPYNYHKVALWLLFATGARIGEVLNLQKKDIELKYNPKTKMNYYLCHIRKEYSKGKTDRTVPIIIPEAINEIQKYVSSLQGDEPLVNLSYSRTRQLLLETSEKAKVRSRPNNKRLTVHTLRKSCALHLLNQGYSIDQVKAWLGHKPSSSVIDVYVNYAGLAFEPEVTKVQTDTLMNLQKELSDAKSQMTVMSQQMSEMQKFQDKVGKLLKLKSLMQ